MIGPVNVPATVSYYILPGLAVLGEDFLATNGSLGFGRGETQSTISIQILSDQLPETAESFDIVLDFPSSSIVLVNPSRATVIINANDDYNGVLSLKPVEESAPYPIIYANEDTERSVDRFVVFRSGGLFGEITVQWILVRNTTDDMVDDSVDVSPTAGIVTLAPGESEKAIILDLYHDLIPEPVEQFLLRLLTSSVTGGARAEGVLQGLLVIEDSDDAHGRIEISEMELVTVNIVASL